jgi:predicted DNA-binding transcriptional regulator AlpA
MHDTGPRLWRFADLKAAGIVRNWPQLKRMVEGAGFPRGYYLTPQARVWDVAEVEAYLKARRGAAQRKPEAA